MTDPKPAAGPDEPIRPSFLAGAVQVRLVILVVIVLTAGVAGAGVCGAARRRYGRAGSRGRHRRS
ncbi:hypothetical protein FZ103_08135 [Streptomonospora sp. PA3]|uniref:hypothetical protein n=1 Tax=Streptomonospora sp. PA3 TaxID=2607326 RepID=UPI0012DD93F9|nr:hypothetical protein [Streptomonospora sp. PA3]MUL41148.1 hypothetical protein [Streptomonospora sp. PA3]